jgi:hypothetical protein
VNLSSHLMQRALRLDPPQIRDLQEPGGGLDAH